MKKLCFIVIVLLGTISGRAHKMISRNNRLTHNRFDQLVGVKDKNPITKAAGDTAWLDGFEDPANWLIYQATDHTSPQKWEIISTVPSNISNSTSKFPKTFQSAKSKFAFINSDADASGVQNASIEFKDALKFSAFGNKILLLRFDTYYMTFTNDTMYVEVSNDGGGTWTSFEASPGVGQSSPSSPGQIEQINISPAIGLGNWSDNVKIRFRYVGSADWFWGVDNVRIVEGYDKDFGLKASWHDNPFTRFEYSQMPLKQAEVATLSPGVIVYNNSPTKQETKITLTIQEAIPPIVVDSTFELGRLEQDTIWFNNIFLPDALGTYTFKFTCLDDQDNSNNSSNAGDLQVTDNTMAHDYGFDLGFGYNHTVPQQTSLANQSYGWGSQYRINQVATVYGLDVAFIKIPSLNATTTPGMLVELNIKEIPSNGNISSAFPVSTIVYTIKSEDISSDGSVITKIPIEPYELEQGKTYIAELIKYDGADESMYIGFSSNNREDDDEAGLYIEKEKYYTLKDNFPAWDRSPIIRLNFDKSLGLNEQTIQSFGVYPNPTNLNTTVSFDVNNASAQLNVTDLSGKLLVEKNLGNVSGLQKIDIDTESFNSGVYLIRLIVNGETSIKKLIVRK